MHDQRQTDTSIEEKGVFLKEMESNTLGNGDSNGIEEVLDIYDISMRHIGRASRSDVHRLGHWHQTFHCWVLVVEERTPHLVFQLRHPEKDTNPNKLDVSSAGHLLTGEGVQEGARELKEEVGIHVTFDLLTPVGVYQERFQHGHLRDYEFCHIFYYRYGRPITTFTLQPDEVSGVFQAPVHEAFRLFTGEIEMLEISGFTETADESSTGCGGNRRRQFEKRKVTVEDFVQRDRQYYLTLFSCLMDGVKASK